MSQEIQDLGDVSGFARGSRDRALPAFYPTLKSRRKCRVSWLDAPAQTTAPPSAGQPQLHSQTANVKPRRLGSYPSRTTKLAPLTDPPHFGYT